MPRGKYIHKLYQGFQKRHTINAGRKCDEETRVKISIAQKGRKLSEEHKRKLKENHKGMTGKKQSFNQIKMMRGNKYAWRGGKIKNERNDPAYHFWVKKVKKRDKNQCTFKGQNCSGYNIVHHIKSWTKYPELRYKINNGITLCQFHHPRKREDERKLIPVFQNLVEAKGRI